MDGVAHLNVEIVSLSHSYPQLTRAARVGTRPARGSVPLTPAREPPEGHQDGGFARYLFFVPLAGDDGIDGSS